MSRSLGEIVDRWRGTVSIDHALLLGRFHERDRVIISAHNRNRLKRPRPGLTPMCPVEV